MGETRIWLGLLGILFGLIILILWFGKAPYTKPVVYNGSYYLLEKHLDNGNVLEYNQLMVEENFDPEVLKLRKLPAAL